MTDNEIIQALECCGDKSLDCTTCPYYDNGQYNCTRGKLFKDAVAAINRQKAEIERLHKEVGYWEAETKEARADIDQAVAEAVKEFAERLKEMASQTFWETDAYVGTEQIDNLVKEMVGEQ